MATNAIDAVAETANTRVERRAEVIVRPFKVDRTKTPEQLYAALIASGRKEWYMDLEVLKTMPMDGPAEGELVFFPLKTDTPVAEFARKLKERNLEPDYAAQMQVNADDSAFADEHPNGMQWGKNSYAFFSRFGAERGVSVRRSSGRWNGSVWGAGRRKVSPQT